MQKEVVGEGAGECHVLCERHVAPFGEHRAVGYGERFGAVGALFQVFVDECRCVVVVVVEHVPEPPRYFLYVLPLVCHEPCHAPFAPYIAAFKAVELVYVLYIAWRSALEQGFAEVCIGCSSVVGVVGHVVPERVAQVDEVARAAPCLRAYDADGDGVACGEQQNAPYRVATEEDEVVGCDDDDEENGDGSEPVGYA